jgi:CubicO group peptidase (beta-lactamase class C family)
MIDKIGMNSMVIGYGGNYVGSSYGWATTRLVKIRLYLHKGNWNGEQVLDESWVKYSAKPTIHLRRNFG